MKNLSKPSKILIIALLFATSYGPIYLGWKAILPSYSGLLAPVANQITNILEFSETHYSLTFEKEIFKIVALRQFEGLSQSQSMMKQEGTRPIDHVSYNLGIWLALGLSTFLFMEPGARRRYLIWGVISLIIFHLCDLFIFAKNANCRLIRGIHDGNLSGGTISYSFAWQWFWWWAFELIQRIINPFLPLGLWIVFCSKSFISELSGESEAQGGHRKFRKRASGRMIRKWE